MDRNDTKALKPRDPRTSVSLKATLWSDQLDPREIEIRNLSRHGVGARCRFGMPPAGEQVTIHIAGFPSISGSVRWNRGDQFGVMLDAEIFPEAFAVTETVDPPRPGIDLGF